MQPLPQCTHPVEAAAAIMPLGLAMWVSNPAIVEATGFPLFAGTVMTAYPVAPEGTPQSCPGDYKDKGEPRSPKGHTCTEQHCKDPDARPRL